MNRDDVFLQVIVFSLLFVGAYIYLVKRDELQLKCVISSVDGNKYCIRDRKQLSAAADLLANVSNKCNTLAKGLYKKYPDKENVLRLYDGFNPSQIVETLPTSEYTAYSENKGEKLAFCLNKKKENNDNLIDENTLTFVALHELAHVCTESIGHGPDFWNNFGWLLKEAEAINVYKYTDFAAHPVNYCGVYITDSPRYDPAKDGTNFQIGTISKRVD